MRSGYVCLLGILLAAAAAAQPAAETPRPAPQPQAQRLPDLSSPLRVTPDTAAGLAVARSTQLAINDQQVQAAQGKLSEVKAMSNPRVTGTASYVRQEPGGSMTLPEEMGGGSITLSPTRVHEEAVQATLPVYLSGQDADARRAARAAVEAAQGSVLQTRLQTALSARQGVYAVLRTQQLEVVAQQRLTAVAEHLRIARAMFDTGAAPRFEVVQAETQVATARGDVIHARTAVAQAKAVLAQLLLAPQSTEIVVEEGVPPALPEGDRHALISRALQERPEIVSLEALVRARQALVRVTRAAYDPVGSLVGQTTNSGYDYHDGGLGWSITAALSVPLYEGGEKGAKIRQAQTDVEIARLNLEQAQQQIALQVTQAALNVDDAREALTVAEQGETEAREQLRIAQVRFASGVGLGVEVLDAQTALASAQTQVVNARYSLQVATASLRAALGLADLTEESGS